MGGGSQLAVVTPRGTAVIADDCESIVQGAFRGNRLIESAVLPETCCSIGRNAFQDCLRLAELIIPPSVSRINELAFCGCKSLTIVDISNCEKLLRIGDRAFGDCTALSHVALPQSIVHIGWNAFENTALATIALPESVQKIGNFAFAGCEQLAEVVLSARTETMPMSFAPTTLVHRLPPRRSLMEGSQFIEAFHGQPYGYY